MRAPFNYQCLFQDSEELSALSKDPNIQLNCMFSQYDVNWFVFDCMMLIEIFKSCFWFSCAICICKTGAVPGTRSLFSFLYIFICKAGTSKRRWGIFGKSCNKLNQRFFHQKCLYIEFIARALIDSYRVDCFRFFWKLRSNVNGSTRFGGKCPVKKVCPVV